LAAEPPFSVYRDFAVCKEEIKKLPQTCFSFRAIEAGSYFFLSSEIMKPASFFMQKGEQNGAVRLRSSIQHGSK
jgi:hypothetical protein